MTSAETTSGIPVWLRSTIVHLRLKNTLHVAPVVLFAISQSPQLSIRGAILTVVILHLFIFPASVGYNSYFDKDTKPTGGIKTPLPVHKSLYWVATGLEITAVGLAWLVNTPFLICILVTIAASRFYSHPKIRIKARPIVGYLWVFFFQGGYSYIMVHLGISGDPQIVLEQLFTSQYLFPAAFCSFLVGGSYPLSQIYQFEEDKARGDITIAIVMGYTGTFLLCLSSLTIGYGFVAMYFVQWSSVVHLLILTGLFTAPFLFVAWWFNRVIKDQSEANHDNAMRMAKISGVFGNLAFIIIGILNHMSGDAL
jgi:4-hydroxybenzoate polyprenyltransferase